MSHNVSRGALTGQSLTGLGSIGSRMQRGRAGLRQSRSSGGLRHGEVQGLGEEPRIRGRTALVPQVQEKRPVRVCELVPFSGCACWTFEPMSCGVKTQGGHAIAAPQHKPERVSHVQATWNFHLCP